MLPDLSSNLNWKNLREAPSNEEVKVFTLKTVSSPPLILHSFIQIALNFSLNGKHMKSLKAYGVGISFLGTNSQALDLEKINKLKGMWLKIWLEFNM